MKTATPQLVTFFNTAKQALQFDLWTFSLANGTVLRWTDADVNILLSDGRMFLAQPVIEREQVQWMRGIEVDQLTCKIAHPTFTIGGQTLPAFGAAGGFDSAWCELERVYMNDAGAVQGWLSWFAGPVADVTPGRMGCEITVKSMLTQLSQQLPRNLYQAGCLNDLFDSNCGFNRAAATYAGTVSILGAGYNPELQVTLAAGVAASFFDIGTLTFLTGANAGFSRSVQLQRGAGTGIWLRFSQPWAFPVSVGDTFEAFPGCDKTQTTCNVKFNNLARFRGQPYIPVPETVT